MVVGYEYFGRPYVIGEAPGRRPGLPLAGARRRIARLLEIEPEELADMFHWQNLLSEWPGYGPNGGSEFPMEAARAAATEITQRPLILLGRRVAQAFDVDQPWFVWRDGLAVCPHPSGLSRWWNDPEHTQQATEFWRTQVLTGSWRD